MRQRFFNAAFAIVCVALLIVCVTLLIVSIDSFKCHRENNMLRATVKAQAESIQESFNTINNNVSMYKSFK